VEAPRGFLFVGQPGTGKSLASQVCCSLFGLPGLRLDAANLFDGLVGATEQNWRAAFDTAKAIAPCVFWIDEVEGLTSGGASSGKTDGGTTNRVIKSILQDMQYNARGIFFVLTSNDIDAIPDPLIDRLKVWSVDLPNAIEREAIWKIHIPKLREDQTEPTDLAKFDLSKLAAATDGFSGRQIEDAWRQTTEIAFNNGRSPIMEDCLAALSRFTPTSITMSEQIEARRRRLAGKATNASTPTPTTNTNNNIRKLAA
jgi:SpoVK/Ycf46/Vps4 family AAA+-type ATPase